jgi:hypothetical protein
VTINVNDKKRFKQWNALEIATIANLLPNYLHTPLPVCVRAPIFRRRWRWRPKFPGVVFFFVLGTLSLARTRPVPVINTQKEEIMYKSRT